jgi:dihydropteroate synthase
MHTAYEIPLPGNRRLTLGRRALVMGILNVTPDSFSDGGAHAGITDAVEHARSMVAAGADIIDLGGESTRPGAEPVGVQDELDRVIPVLDALRVSGLTSPISIDTYKPLVADQAIQSGASIINDVHGLQGDPEMAAVAAHHQVPLIAMHWDRDRDSATPLIESLRRWFDRTIEIAGTAGLRRNRLILDPGFGFGKSLAENYALLMTLDQFHPGYPILCGTSRKSMIGRVLGNTPDQRQAGTIATSVLAYERGAHIFRVHDVAENRDALRIAEAALYGPTERSEPA